ncbi:putative iron-regulated protein [Archangium gephyra]|uniref:Iron-regulated protein n=1 Tax=Archangium gephyra TaxID=48 RepID=A0AAC8QGT4_9BACT|nr:imelysin family protein [Archangium gephyra]AKJ07134.1 Iron-regulated protein A precursor [Archangium gephyra]REG26546.1 putative iron-regulated protein [Archangium gephyra]
MKKLGWMALVAGALTSVGCGTEPLEESRARPVVERYAALVHENYSDAVTKARELRATVDAFVADPTEAKLTSARGAWLAARPAYGQSEAFRFYGGPIDDEDTGPEGRINAWPLDEAYIDSVEGAPEAGIINATTEYPTLSEELLISLNERDGETNIATGYHAIEFLLWGQDRSVTGPGNRPASDFVTAPNAARRRQYLKLATDLLVKDLESVQAQWAPGADNYGKKFSAQEPEEAVLQVLTGLGSLSGAELSGERMTVAYDNKDQEDEHSCFSDNTKADLYANALGIQNVYLGRYGTQDGKGLDELVAAVDAKLDTEMKQRLQASLDAIQAIPGPFDQAITGAENAEGRQKVKAAIDALKAQTDTLVDVATALGITLNLE